jgi:hypothetical protein
MSKHRGLPTTKWDPHDFGFLSFSPSATEVLGVYDPGARPVLFDFAWDSADRVPNATRIHEETHQFLSINSTFGLFTQLIGKLAEHGHGREAYRLALQCQWEVQELTAVYAEMTFVARNHPDRLDEQIRHLPSSRLGQPPYREVFDAVRRWVPVDISIGEERLTAQDTFVGFMALAAMNGDALLKLAGRGLHESSLVACMTETPRDRFGTLMELLLPTGKWRQIVDSHASLSRAKGVEVAARQTWSLVRQAFPGAVFDDADVLSQANLATDRWHDDWSRLGVQFGPPKRYEEPLAAIVESSEHAHELVVNNPPDRLHANDLATRFEEIQKGGFGLSLEISLPPDKLAFVKTRPYLMGPGDTGMPASDEQVADMTGILPHDFAGIIPASELLTALQPFPTLPHIVTFIERGWRNWYRLPGGRLRFARCIRVCRQANLGEQELRENILAFHEIGRAAEFFVVSLKADRYVACFFNRRVVGVYGLQKIASSAALQLFESIVKRLQVPACDNAEARRHVDLVTMIGYDFFGTTAGTSN